MKSIVITGSICSITTGAPDDNKKRVYTNESWSEITPEFARTYTTYRPDYVKYCSSKKEAELAIWEFVRSEKPGFSVSFTHSVNGNRHVRLRPLVEICVVELSRHS